MEDKMLMEGLLWDTKVLLDLVLHGSIESSNDSVHKMFLLALKDLMTMQTDIYSIMSEKRWYSSDTVEESKLESARQKFAQLIEEK